MSNRAQEIIAHSYAKRIRTFAENVIQNNDLINTQKTLAPDMSAVKAASVLFIKSLLLGLDHATEKTEFAEDDLDIDVLPFEEALGYLQKRLTVDKKTYYELADKLKFRAFTVSRIADGDLLVKVKSLLEKSLETGSGLKDFLEQTNEQILGGVGLGKGNGFYWETVYRTNVQTSYNVGKAIGFDSVPPAALELVGIGDLRQTNICRSLTQPPVRLPYDDPFWQTRWPPFHFNCRTTVRAIYDESELKDEGLHEAPKDAVSPKKGFGTYPLSSDAWWDELTDQKARAVKYGVQAEIVQAKKLLEVQSGGKAGGSDLELTGLLKKTDKTESDYLGIGTKIINQAKNESKGVFEIMKRYRSFGSESAHAFAKSSSVFAKEEIKKAMQYYPKDWIEKSVAASVKKQLIAKSTMRGYYARELNTISIDKNFIRGKQTTAIHEMAHRFESLYPDIVKAEKEFYERRTAGENLQSLKKLTGLNYKEYEKAKQDEFLDVYMGKDYNGTAYEILSMGIEYLANPLYNPINKSYKIDENMNSFIIGLLLGV